MLQAIIYLRKVTVNFFKKTGYLIGRIFFIILILHLLLIGFSGLFVFLQGIYDNQIDVAFGGMITNYICISILTFFVYYFDKRAARKGNWRIPEKRLHYLELSGGWIGALMAQKFLHHKSRKASFQLVYWLIVIFHLSLLLFYLPIVAPFIPFYTLKNFALLLNIFLLLVTLKAIDEKGNVN